MNVSTITMEPEVAKQKLHDYRRALGKRHSKEVHDEWSAAERAYRELAKGTPLVDPISAIREAGWRPDGTPVLAMTRADQRVVHWSILRTPRYPHYQTNLPQGEWTPMTWSFRGAKDRRDDRQRSPDRIIEVDSVMDPPPVNISIYIKKVTMVPMVPPDVLPSSGCDLSKHFILWEVDKWEVAPPVDPILLKPIGGNLYAVVAQWDLTELERAIIAGTRK